MSERNAAPLPWAGIWPAMVTPLDERLDIDQPLFTAHARALIDAGCAGVTPFGTTGEGPSFSVDERRRAIDGMIEGGVPAGRILVSTSCAAIPDAIALTRHAVQSGARGVLLLPPFFLKGVSDRGIVDAYVRIIDGVADDRLRVVLYHIPQVSGVPLSHTVVEELLRRYPDTIIGIKDSGGKRDVSEAFARAFMPPLQVWVGNEPDLQALGALGARGAISGLGNIAPRLVARLVDGHAGPGAAEDQRRLMALIGILGGYGLTAAFKGIMAHISGHAGWRRVRPPLVALDDAQFPRICAQIDGFGLDRARD